MNPLDSLDRRLLALLQVDAKQSNQKLAELVGMSASPCWRRIKQLGERGIIERYTAILDPVKLGIHAMAYVEVSLIDHLESTIVTFNDFVTAHEQVIECCSITGERDYLMKVVATDSEALEVFIMKGLLGTGVVRSSNTNFVLRRIKSGTALPVG